jgi:formylglycine-generating enzyme required for sulfatase activity
MITRVFFIRLGNTNKVSLVDRSVVERVLKEHAFQAGDWSNPQKTAELRTALNADWIVRGEIEKFTSNSNILVTVQFYDLRTFRYMGGTDLLLANANEAYDKIDPLVNKLVETISGSSAGGGSAGTGASGASTTSGTVGSGGSGGGVSGTGGGETRQSTSDTRPATSGTPAGFVLVPAGTFTMGSANEYDDEKPVHQVTISKPFYMSDHEVTQKEWVEVMGTTIRQQRDKINKISSLYGEGDNYPMYYVSWYEAIEYCNKRSIKEGLTPAYSGSGNNITCNFTANGYRLPTEAEWEWAAKGGGKDFMVYEYSGSNGVDEMAWYRGNSGSQTHPVKTKGANSLGLYDMSGNVWEWCWDRYGSYSSGSQTDPAGAAGGSDRVLRGGAYINDTQLVRSASRYDGPPSGRNIDRGFRLVRP